MARRHGIRNTKDKQRTGIRKKERKGKTDRATHFLARAWHNSSKILWLVGPKDMTLPAAGRRVCRKIPSSKKREKRARNIPWNLRSLTSTMSGLACTVARELPHTYTHIYTHSCVKGKKMNPSSGSDEPRNIRYYFRSGAGLFSLSFSLALSLTRFFRAVCVCIVGKNLPRSLD